VESLDDPDYETPLLASRNAVQISGTGHNVVLQQGTEASHQQATISSEQRTQVARFAEDFESALEESPLDEPDQSSARAALSTVQGQLALPEAEPTLVQAAVSVMQRIALGATTGVATSAAWEGVKELARQL